jgi:hypothetical protein
VVEVAAGLAAQVGDIRLALELAEKIDDPVDRRLATGLALTGRQDTHPEAATEFRAALDEITSDTRRDQKIRILLGLSLVATLDEDELAQLDALDPENADMYRAQSLLSVGDVAQAQILARRYPRTFVMGRRRSRRPISLSVVEGGQAEGPGVVSGGRRVPLLRAGSTSRRDG